MKFLSRIAECCTEIVLFVGRRSIGAIAAGVMLIVLFAYSFAAQLASYRLDSMPLQSVDFALHPTSSGYRLEASFVALRQGAVVEGKRIYAGSGIVTSYMSRKRALELQRQTQAAGLAYGSTTGNRIVLIRGFESRTCAAIFVGLWLVILGLFQLLMKPYPIGPENRSLRLTVGVALFVAGVLAGVDLVCWLFADRLPPPWVNITGTIVCGGLAFLPLMVEFWYALISPRRYRDQLAG